MTQNSVQKIPENPTFTPMAKGQVEKVLVQFGMDWWSGRGSMGMHRGGWRDANCCFGGCPNLGVREKKILKMPCVDGWLCTTSLFI